MKRFALILLGVVLLAVCVMPTGRRADPFQPGREDCVSVEVDNRQFADVNVWVGERRRLLDMVTGFTRTRFDICDWQGVRAVFTVRPIGGAFDTFEEDAANPWLNPRHSLRLVIYDGPTRSYVVGP